MNVAAASNSIPSHVPPHLVVPGFDIFAISPPDGDASAAWIRAVEGLPSIFWSNENGGHWTATRADTIKAVQLDGERYSLSEFALPKGRQGVQLIPLVIDAPAHAGYRRIIFPAFSPKAVAALEQTSRKVIREVIERLVPRGECEFVEDVAHILPITVFLGMMGLPQEDAAMLIPLGRQNTQAKDAASIQSAQLAMAAYMQRAIDDRRANPRDDVLTQVVFARYEDRPLSEEEVLGMSTLLLAGGLDTVAAMMSFHARFLATHPQHLAKLVENPKLIPRAMEELFRRNALVNTTRLVREDTELEGIKLLKGDMILIPNCFYGLDPDKVEDPMTVDFDRPPPYPHAAFGNGAHVCPGAALTRMEIRVWLEEWLPRIPRFQITPGTTPVSTVGGMNAMRELWLTWDPAAA